ncbi:hypothetical protein H105_02180 [Trichophyton soudanense CBS 452.61]|uniref:Uncharacterized protein n=1 Tax=Trichophyton soudanense CBS 452.61 TaxID=1215331 RepID=A0A022Y0T1_TRISD|nr:hypothetical protein H105_02180 [Trichophyton soudanense CBS 452.61]
MGEARVGQRGSKGRVEEIFQASEHIRMPTDGSRCSSWRWPRGICSALSDEAKGEPTVVSIRPTRDAIPNRTSMSQWHVLQKCSRVDWLDFWHRVNGRIDDAKKEKN